MMRVVQTLTFSRTAKKLHTNQKRDLDEAVKAIIANPQLGEPKVGNLKGISVYKFKMVKQATLLAYNYQHQIITLTLLAVGSHENFYRDLNK